MTRNEIISNVVRNVARKCGNERGVACAIDCLLQLDKGEMLFNDTLRAWQRHVMETDEGEEHRDVNRNGMMVPEILV